MEILSAMGAGGAIAAIAMRDSLSNVAGGIILLFLANLTFQNYTKKLLEKN